jgi:hypothetical protein
MDAPESSLERAALEAAHTRARTGDKQRLRRLGVVHTPLALVHFALGRIEHALRADFALAEGLSSDQLQVLDPAVGTGIWLSALLARLSGVGPHAVLGFDADAEVTAQARALLAPAAHAYGLSLELAQRNTLELADPWRAGDHVRVVLGNPPWGARSLSRGLALNDAWLREFHRDHRGEPLRERRAGVLSDDYVRFFRWGLEQARTAPRGAVLCFVTNASYLDGPVHRGMRAALSACFDRIEVFDLGGGSLRSRDGARDAPLFPVRVPAALAVCVQRPRGVGPARVSHARVTGSAERKLAQLARGEDRVRTFTPDAPWFRFVPERPAPQHARDGIALDAAFPFQREGVQTNRDALVSDPDRTALRARLERIARGALALPGARHFDPTRARLALERALEREPEALIGELAYRPLEARFYCTLPPLCHRPRPELARAVRASGLCLYSVRKEPGARAWNMFALGTALADSSYLSVRSACRTRVFPSHDPDGAPNLSAPLVEQLGARLGRAPEVREVLLYVAGVLGSASYRREHEQALKHDYPRVPWPRDETQFLAHTRAGDLFLRALCPGEVIQPTLSVHSLRAASERVSWRTLRWISPHQLELCSGTEIGARKARPFHACVGHHDLVARAYGRDGSATIAEVHTACERAAMWVEAEKAADEAYQAASSVGRAAKGVAGGD